MITIEAPSSETRSPSKPTSAPARDRFRGGRLFRILLSITLTTACAIGLAGLGIATDWKLTKASTLLGQKATSEEDWCKEHGVVNSECVECNPDLHPRTRSTKWCKEHGVPECPHCHPEIAELATVPTVTGGDQRQIAEALAFAPRIENDPKCKKHERRIQLASDDVARRLGMTMYAVTRGAVDEVVTAPGEFVYDATRYARIAPRTAGHILRVERQVGDKVRRGDLLAVIESPEVGKAKSDFQQAIVQSDLRRERFAKLRTQAGSVPGKDLLAAEASVEEADVRVLTAEAGLSNLGLAIRSEDVRGSTPAELAKKMQYLGLPEGAIMAIASESDSSNFLPLTAPFDGEVLVRTAAVGEAADPAKPLFSLADASRMWLTLQVRQEDVNRVKVGQTVRFRHGGHTGASAWDPGIVAWISPAADEKTRTVPVRVHLANPTDRHYANTAGTAEVVLREASNAILVPAGAVHWEGCCHVVFVRDKAYGDPEGLKVFHVRKVRIGARKTTSHGDMVEIAAGLLPGEVVAAANSGFLRSELLKNNLGEGCACCAGK